MLPYDPETNLWKRGPGGSVYHSPPVAAKDGGGFAGALKRKARGASPLSTHTVAPAGGGLPAASRPGPYIPQECLRQVFSGFPMAEVIDLVSNTEWRQSSKCCLLDTVCTSLKLSGSPTIKWYRQDTTCPAG